MGLYELAGDIGAAFGPLSGGWLYETIGQAVWCGVTAQRRLDCRIFPTAVIQSRCIFVLEPTIGGLREATVAFQESLGTAHVNWGKKVFGPCKSRRSPS